MRLTETLAAELKAAMKAQDSVTVSTIRLLLSDIKYAEIEKGSQIADDEVVAVIKRSVKKRKEAIDMYVKGGRDELAEAEKEEMAVLKKYLPDEMSDEDIAVIVRECIAGSGASGPSDMGRVMQLVMKKTGGRADGKTVNMMVMEALRNLGEEG